MTTKKETPEGAPCPPLDENEGTDDPMVEETAADYEAEEVTE